MLPMGLAVPLPLVGAAAMAGRLGEPCLCCAADPLSA